MTTPSFPKNTSADMKRCLLIAAGLLLSLSLSAQPLKVGLVLGGGGAKGAATIQILKEIDAAKIPIHCVVGTSIGALIGGLYAYGYTPEEIENLYNETGARDILGWVGLEKLSNRKIGRGLMSIFGVDQGDQTLEMLQSKVGVNTTFRDTRIPFRCVATDMDHGMSAVVLGETKSDNLALALRASMSVPLVFNRVNWHGRFLSDGGLINNLPVDVARAMGAEVVIAVDLEQEGEDLPWFLDYLPWIRDVIDVAQFISLDDKLGLETEQLLDWLEIRPDKAVYERNRADADYYFNPNLHGFNMASFRDSDKRAMKGLGRDAVDKYEHWEGISRLGGAPPKMDFAAMCRLSDACSEGLSLPFRTAQQGLALNPALEAAYDIFLAGCYLSPRDGQEDAAFWMGYYSVRGQQARVHECEAVLRAFLGMAHFFEGYFPSGDSFRSQSSYMASRFENSPYPVVRNTWCEISTHFAQ